MAEARILDHLSADQFTCPLSLDLLKDPVTIPCGHSFCKLCINDCWDQEDEKRVYSCPQCKETFTQRPVLRRNNMLAELMEKLEKAGVRAASPAHCYAGPGDVECEFCTGRKNKALKSCLMCLTSFCETHLKDHLEIPGLKKHTLIEASSNLQEKICSQHDKPIEIYCRTDQRSICSLCMLDNHKVHDTVSLSAERTEKQCDLKEEQMKSQQKIQEKQKKVDELKQTVITIKSRAQTAVEENEIVFTEMISSMEKKRSEVTERIRAQEKAELSRVEQLLEQLEQEITDLKRKVTELEQLSHTHDNLHFIQRVRSLCVSSGCEDSPGIIVHPPLSYDGLRNSLSELKKQFKEFCEEEFHKIPPYDFLDLTLDPDTAHHFLCLWEKNRVVTCRRKKQLPADHPEKFDSYHQVLCKESVSERCYWEVEWKGDGGVEIAVSYKDISRKGRGKECDFGRNNQSWSLCCSPSSLCFYHDDIKTDLSVPSSTRIGVYVDHSAGSLNFYSVSDTMRLLHRVHTTFTQPLYAGFKLALCSTLKLNDTK